VPQLVGSPCLETDGRVRAGDAGIVQPRRAEQPVDGRPLQQPGRDLDQTLRRLDAIGFQKLDATGGRDVPTFLVGGPDLQRGDDLGIAFHLRLRRDPRRTVVGPAHRPGPVQLAQRPRYSVEIEMP
jgi:hypothetical protein